MIGRERVVFMTDDMVVYFNDIESTNYLEFSRTSIFSKSSRPSRIFQRDFVIGKERVAFMTDDIVVYF